MQKTVLIAERNYHRKKYVGSNCLAGYGDTTNFGTGEFCLFKNCYAHRSNDVAEVDFQLIFIAAGKAHFHFDNNDEETIVHAGHMVLYRPREPQKYEYYAKDQVEVYWVHFTGKYCSFLWIDKS